RRTVAARKPHVRPPPTVRLGVQTRHHRRRSEETGNSLQRDRPVSGPCLPRGQRSRRGPEAVRVLAWRHPKEVQSGLAIRTPSRRVVLTALNVEQFLVGELGPLLDELEAPPGLVSHPPLRRLIPLLSPSPPPPPP